MKSLWSKRTKIGSKLILSWIFKLHLSDTCPVLLLGFKSSFFLLYEIVLYSYENQFLSFAIFVIDFPTWGIEWEMIFVNTIFFSAIFSDFDECLARSDDCQQTCVNTHGSFRCECHAGFILEKDRKSCQGKLSHPWHHSFVHKSSEDVLSRNRYNVEYGVQILVLSVIVIVIV